MKARDMRRGWDNARAKHLRPAKPIPRVCEVHIPAYDAPTDAQGNRLEGSALRAQLIELGIITPIGARQPMVAQDDIGRFEAANGIFYSEGRGVVEYASQDPAIDPGVRRALQILRADPVAFEARENMFQPGGGKVRWERFPHPAPEEDDTTASPKLTDDGLEYPSIGRPSPERGALQLVMSVRDVHAIPGTDDRGRWLGTARVTKPAMVGTERKENDDLSPEARRALLAGAYDRRP